MEVGVKLNYDVVYEKVMLDYLILMFSFYGDIVNYLDGSYEGFEWKWDGKWYYVFKVFY